MRLNISFLLLLLASRANAAVPPVPAFSHMQAGGTISGWQPLRPAPNAADTRYSLVTDGAGVVLKADAVHSMSGLIYPVRVRLAQFPLLRWRWKIAAPVKSADMTKKSGDDYAARIYVMFDYPYDKLSFGTRMKLQLATAIYGQKLPTAALNYVWDNRAPAGTLQANVYTDRARMMVLQSGVEKSGTWVEETRDLAADFRLAFGEHAPDVVAIAVATDTDNTGESATAWYGDIRFLPAGAAGQQ
jgi:hypothetical protein